MLSLNEKDAKEIGGKKGYRKIAVSENDRKFEVFLVTHNCYGAKPCIKPDKIDSLLTDSDWLETACKKYRLPAKEIRKLKRTWSLGAPTFESDNVKAQLCFREMEKTLIGRMKRQFTPQKNYKLLPWLERKTIQNLETSTLSLTQRRASRPCSTSCSVAPTARGTIGHLDGNWFFLPCIEMIRHWQKHERVTKKISSKLIWTRSKDQYTCLLSLRVRCASLMMYLSLIGRTTDGRSFTTF